MAKDKAKSRRGNSGSKGDLMGRSGSDVPRVDEGAREDNIYTGPVGALRWLRYWLPLVSNIGGKVLAYYSTILDNDTQTAWINSSTIEAIMEGTGLSRPSVVKARRELEECGAILMACRWCGPLQECPKLRGHIIMASAVMPRPEGQQTLFDDDDDDHQEESKGKSGLPSRVNEVDSQGSTGFTQSYSSSDRDLTGGRGTPNVPMVDNSDTTDSGATNQITDKPKTPAPEVEDDSERRITKITKTIGGDRDAVLAAVAEVAHRGQEITRSRWWALVGVIARCYAGRCDGKCAGTDTGEGVVHGRAAMEYHRANREDAASERAGPSIDIPEHLEAVIGFPVGQRLEAAISHLHRAHRISQEYQEFERAAPVDRAQWTPEIRERWDELYDRTGGGAYFAHDAADQQLQRIEFAAWDADLQTAAWRHYVLEVAGGDWRPDPECECLLCHRSWRLLDVPVEVRR